MLKNTIKHKKQFLLGFFFSLSLMSFIYINLQNPVVSETIANNQANIEKIIEEAPSVLADFNLVKIFVSLFYGVS
jgi:hypothetical protein